jgi:hypothetical protein
MNSFEINRKLVIRRILEIESQHQILTEESIRQENKALFDEACELFGTWALALKYAGVRKKRQRNRKWKPEIVIKQIRRRVARLNSVKAMNVRKANHSLYRAGVDMFGSWQNALDAAGIDRNRMYFGPLNPRLENDQIFELLRERTREGKSMRFTDFACENFAVARTIETRFRNWNRALILAGLRREVESEQA